MHIAEKKKYTVDDFILLDERSPFQLINYDLIVPSSHNAIHQGIILRLGQMVLNFLDNESSNAYVGTDVDVKFDNGNVFRPDLVFITEERRKENFTDGITGIPDMLIEILSVSSAYYDLRHKKDIYEKFGVKEYIIIDPIDEAAELYKLENGNYVLHQQAKKTEKLFSVLLPGLIFYLNRIFN